MAQLDRLLALLPADRTGTLTLVEGQPARIETGPAGASRSVTRMPLTGAQIVALLREVASPEASQCLERGAATSFTFVGPAGSFSVGAEPSAAGWHVRVTGVETGVLTLITEAGELLANSLLSPDESRAMRDRGPRSAAQDRVEQLLLTTVKRGASDLHLRAGEPPLLRCQGEIARLEGAPRLRADETAALIDSTMTPSVRDTFAATGDADFAYEFADIARFRVNVFRDRTGVSAVFRRIPPAIVTAEALGLPPEIQQLALLPRGLVLVTGPTGSGKSTTLCALLDLVNRSRADHIITIEDPIEFVHESKRCVVSQREIGVHTRSFKTALRAALREDPDVVLIGEMRDLETASIALETAETGHLVFATLHTTTAAMTIDRIIDQFPGDQQEQIRVMLADSLRGVISQTLVKRAANGRVAAREVLFNTAPVANLIRERKTFQIPAIIQTSKRTGMITMNDALLDLVESQEVSVQEAVVHASDRTAFLNAARARGFDVSFDAELGPRRSRMTTGSVTAA